MKIIPKKQYIEIMRSLPIFCVDVVLRNSKGEYFLVKRKNEPKKGRWWVIGGRLLKGESLIDAVRRKVKEESGQNAKNIKPLGYFELIGGVNPVGLDFKYHTISIVFSAGVAGNSRVVLDGQSCSYKFSKKLPSDFCIKPISRFTEIAKM